MSHPYSNLELTGKMDQGIFKANTIISDPGLAASAIIQGSFDQGSPSLSGKVIIDRADLKMLGWSGDSVIISGIVDILSFNPDPGNFIVSTNINNGWLYHSGTKYHLDSIEINAVSKKEGTEILVVSPFIESEFKSSYPSASCRKNWNRQPEHFARI